MGKRETEITNAIRYMLKGLGIFHWKVHQSLGSQPGVSDILGIWPNHLGEHQAGTFVAIEVKTPKGKLSDHQAQFLNAIQDAGGIAIVARSVDDVIDGLGVRQRFLF